MVRSECSATEKVYLMIDLHCHILPGIDDGSPDWESSLAMAQIAAEDGIEGVVCTPHWVFGLYENTHSVVLNATQELRARLNARAIALEVYPGSELRLDFNLVQGIESKQLMTLNDSGRYALIELPEQVLPQQMANFFGDLLSRDITPLIAHPERNRVLIRHPERLFEWVQMGALCQITASSVLGRFGKEIRNFSISLLEHDLIHVLATDSHGPRSRVPRLGEGLKAVANVVGEERAREMVLETPRRIVRGENVSTPDPVPFKSGSHHSSFLRKFFSLAGLSRRS